MGLQRVFGCNFFPKWKLRYIDTSPAAEQNETTNGGGILLQLLQFLLSFLICAPNYGREGAEELDGLRISTFGSGELADVVYLGTEGDRAVGCDEYGFGVL